MRRHAVSCDRCVSRQDHLNLTVTARCRSYSRLFTDHMSPTYVHIAAHAHTAPSAVARCSCVPCRRAPHWRRARASRSLSLARLSLAVAPSGSPYASAPATPASGVARRAHDGGRQSPKRLQPALGHVHARELPQRAHRAEHRHAAARESEAIFLCTCTRCTHTCPVNACAARQRARSGGGSGECAQTLKIVVAPASPISASFHHTCRAWPAALRTPRAHTQDASACALELRRCCCCRARADARLARRLLLMRAAALSVGTDAGSAYFFSPPPLTGTTVSDFASCDARRCYETPRLNTGHGAC